MHGAEDTPGVGAGWLSSAVDMTRNEPPRPGLAVLLAWLVPGGGHLFIRRPWPALFVAGAVLPLFVLGMHLAGYENVSPVRHSWYFGLQSLAALPTAFATLLTEDVVITRHLPHRSVGVLYTAVAGLLNLMAIADVWARCRRGDPADETATPDPSQVETIG